MRADGPRQRRRRLDPHPGLLLRAVRSQADARAQPARARRRRRLERRLASGTPSRAPCATAPRCSTPSPARSPAIRTAAPPPARPFLAGGRRAIPAGCASRFTTAPSTACPSTPNAPRPRAPRPRCCDELGPPRRGGAARDRREALVPASPVIVAANVACPGGAPRRRSAGRSPRPRRADDLGSRGRTPRVSAADYARSIWIVHRVGRAVAPVLPALRRAALADLCQPPLPLGVLDMSSPTRTPTWPPCSRASASPRSSTHRATRPCRSRCDCTASGLPIGCSSSAASATRPTLFPSGRPAGDRAALGAAAAAGGVGYSALQGAGAGPVSNRCSAEPRSATRRGFRTISTAPKTRAVSISSGRTYPVISTIGSRAGARGSARASSSPTARASRGPSRRAQLVRPRPEVFQRQARVVEPVTR